MCPYANNIDPEAIPAAIYLYSDGTEIRNSRSLSVYLIRMTLVNVIDSSYEWHKIRIRQHINPTYFCSDAALLEERTKLKHKFWYLILRDTISASKFVLILFVKLIIIRVDTLVCDPKEELALLSLRSQSSYMSCSHFFLFTLAFLVITNNLTVHPLPLEACTSTSETSTTLSVKGLRQNLREMCTILILDILSFQNQNCVTLQLINY